MHRILLNIRKQLFAQKSGFESWPRFRFTNSAYEDIVFRGKVFGALFEGVRRCYRQRATVMAENKVRGGREGGREGGRVRGVETS